MDAENNSNRSKKRERGPYLSYLTNPLKEKVPRSTLRFWSRESHEGNAGKSLESCGLAHTSSSIVSDENVEEAGEVLLSVIEDELADSITCSKFPENEFEQGEMISELTSVEQADDIVEQQGNGMNASVIEDPEIENIRDPNEPSHLFYDETAFADDCDEEVLEELWEDEENIEETSREETQQSDLHVEEKFPLYTGARITLGMSLLLIITFAMRHQLSGTALADLLTLIDLHLISPNCFTRSMTTLHKFFKQLKNPVQFHYYCSFCYEYIGIQKQACCTNKHCLQDLTKKNSLSYFIVIPLEPQLEALLARADAKDLLSFRQTRKKKNEQSIEDVLDGRLYKAHFDNDGYFKGTEESKKKSELHISLQINTDGVALFRSSTFSIWPVYYIINELPPNCRFHRKNRLFGGLWFGTKKPHFQTFMQPFAISLRDLFHKGATISSNGDSVKVRCLLLCGTFDAPAKCLFQSFVQFNGSYGCPYCLHPGKTVKTSEKGHTHAYPFNRDNLQTGHFEIRTHDQTKKFAKQATESIINTGVEKPEKGVKGLSWFLYVPAFNLIRGTAIDYMHGTLLGVVKMLVNLWLDKQHHDEPWYIGKWARELEKRYVSIKPPSCISRLPRSIVGNFGHLKASELRSFLLFYSLPCLYGLLPDSYFQHYLLLVEAIYILLKHSISSSDLTKAAKLLKHFCIRVEELYGSRYETYNIHCLLHLVDRVKDLGPLWTHSCFCFEDYNGELRHFFHGTQHVEMQIVLSICVQQKIPELIPLLPPNSSALQFFEELTSKGRLNQKREIVAENIFIVGAVVRHTLNVHHRQLVERDMGNVGEVFKFKRVLIGTTIFHCKDYKPGIRRNNFTVQFQSPSCPQPKYGQILYFIKFYVKCPNPVFCSDMCPCKVPHCRAIIEHLLRDDGTVLSTDAITGASAPHIVPVLSTSETVVIPLDMIVQVCVHIDCGSDGKRFVATFPNMFEKD